VSFVVSCSRPPDVGVSAEREASATTTRRTETARTHDGATKVASPGREVAVHGV
jgi:hypothetical protein